MLPDNRIRFPGPPIDFDSEVGTTGQAHDTFPAPGQARFDWLRSYLIGLLSNQASYTTPIEFRVGSLWFNLNDNSFQFRSDNGAIINVSGENWLGLAHGIVLEPGLTLAQWFEQVKDIITQDSNLSRGFSRLTTAIADEPISAGSFVYVSGNRKVAMCDSSMPGKTNSIGVATNTSDIDGTVVVQHIGLTKVRMQPGLVLQAGDKIFLGTGGRGSTTGSMQLGVVFDASVYDGTASDPYALAVIGPSKC